MRRITPIVVIVLLCSMAVPAGADHNSGSVSGTVTDADGLGIADICVWAYGDEYGGSARTRLGGHYRIDGVSAGEYRISFFDCASGPRYVSEFYDDVRSSADATLVAVEEGSDVTGIDAELAAAGTIAGTITNQEGAPLEGVCITALVVDVDGDLVSGPSMPRSGPDGSYEVHVEPGEWHIGFFGCDDTERYVDEWYDDARTTDEATTVTVESGSTTSGIDASLALGGSIKGVVTTEDGAPLADVCVSVYTGFWNGARTDAEGSYEVLGIEAGAWNVSYYDCTYRERPYLQEWYDDAETYEAATPVPVALGEVTEGIDAALELGGSISGHVAGEGDVPFDTSIRVYDEDGSLVGWGWVSDDYGPDWVVGGLRTGTYYVEFVPGWLSWHEPEWYDDASDLEHATPVDVVVGADTPGVDAELELGPVPDPSVAGVRVDPGQEVVAGVEPGQDRTVTVTVENLGERSVGVAGRLYIEACPVTVGRCNRFGHEVGELAGGESRELTFDWSHVIGAGDYTVTAYLDSWEDADPSNNSAETTASILVGGGGTGVGVL